MQLKTPTPELEAYKRGYEQGRFDAEMDLLNSSEYARGRVDGLQKAIEITEGTFSAKEIPGFEGTLQALGKI